MERIWGPVNGFWLAAYAAPASDGEHFCSYAKVCWTRPESYWEADCIFKIFGGEQHRSVECALGAVALDARNEISCLLPRRQRAVARRRRRHSSSLPQLILTSLRQHWA